MKVTILENTERYVLCEYTDGVNAGFVMFDKTRSKHFLVSGTESAGFFEYYRNSLVAWGTEGSTYFMLSKNQVLAQVFNQHAHRATEYDLAPSDYLKLLQIPTTLN